MVIILQPVIVLAGWTLLMCLWMYATRLPGMAKAKVDPDSLARDPDMSLDKVLPPQTQWKAHNFNHLHEAPTVFYAVCGALVLAMTWQAPLASDAVGLAVLLAWTYVALRITHSLVQVTINKVVIRFTLFALSQLVLIGLIAIAALAVFNLEPPSGIFRH